MNSKLQFKVASTKDDFTLALPLVKLLNPSITEEDYWLYIKEMQEMGNYSLHLAYAENQLVGISGCWIATKFYCGKYLEIDNFIIAANAQRKGYGRTFLEYINTLAIDANCATIMLDAYLENEQAHAFYKECGYFARGYHFLKEIKKQ